MARFDRMIFQTLGAILLIVFGAAPASASPITFSFQGTLTAVNSALSGTFSVGETIAGSYTFESTTPDIAPGDPNFGGYLGASTNLSFTVDGYSGSFSSSGFNATTVALSFAGVDLYQVNIPFTGPLAGTASPDLFALEIQDTDQNAFATDALPLSPPNLALFEVRKITVFFRSAEGGESLAFVASLNQIPEPSTLMLLGLGLAGVGGLRRRWR